MKWIILTLALMSHVATAFQPQLPPNSLAMRRTFLGSTNAEYSETEVQEMEDLILTLSKEPTDESRRTRLKSVFTEALARPNGAPKRFSNLFDQTLIVLGDRIREKAMQKALEAQQAGAYSSAEGHQPEEDASGKSATASDDYMAGKSEEERQVWALVDMMVQSKTIVKRASGELGSSSSFA